MSDAASAAILILWLTWAVGTSLALRHLLARTIKRLLPKSTTWLVGACVFLAVFAILIGSYHLHEAILGPMAVYGAKPAEAFSVSAYALAPFGFPLLIGSLLLLPYDLTNCIIPPRCWTHDT